MSSMERTEAERLADLLINSVRLRKEAEPFAAAEGLLVVWGLDTPEWNGSRQELAYRLLAHWCELDLDEARFALDMVMANLVNDPIGFDKAIELPFHWKVYEAIQSRNLPDELPFAAAPFNYREELVQELMVGREDYLRPQDHEMRCLDVASRIAYAACDGATPEMMIERLKELLDACRKLKLDFAFNLAFDALMSDSEENF